MSQARNTPTPAVTFRLSKAELVLVFITMLWGGTFLLVHNVMTVSGPMFFVGLRFAAAALFVGVVSARALPGLTFTELKAGMLIGVSIMLGYGLQTMGLQTISSSQSAFITALYVPFVPLLQWLVLGRRPGLMPSIGICLAFIGLMLLAGPEGGSLHFSEGEVVTLVSAVAIAGDIGERDHCKEIVDLAIRKFGRLDILVNNAGEQHPDKDVTEITKKQLKRTFQTNVYGMFYLVQAAMPFLGKGASIINCTSVTMYQGAEELLDYSATKGAITAFTRSLSQNLAEKGIRVNGVAPGPIWTPLNPMGGASKEKLETFGEDTPMGRPGQPNEVAPSFLFLACEDSSYMTGQVLHPNGGIIVGS